MQFAWHAKYRMGKSCTVTELRDLKRVLLSIILPSDQSMHMSKLLMGGERTT